MAVSFLSTPEATVRQISLRYIWLGNNAFTTLRLKVAGEIKPSMEMEKDTNVNNFQIVGNGKQWKWEKD